MAVIVERIEPDSEAERAGIHSGYRLERYQGRALLSPEALLGFEENTFGTERVLLQGERDGQPWEAVVKPGRLGIETRPVLSADSQAAYERGWQAFQAERCAEAAEVWSKAARNAEAKSVAAWLCRKAGEAAEKVLDWQAAESHYLQANDLLQDGQDTAAQSAAWMGLGRCRQFQSDQDAAMTWYAQALQADEGAGRLRWAARSLHALGQIARRRGELDAAQDYFTRAHDLLAPILPDSLEMTISLSGLGMIVYHHGDLGAAKRRFLRALTLQQRLPGSQKIVQQEIAKSLNNLGIVTADQGDLTTALDYFLRSLALRERLAPASMELADSLNNIGGVAYLLRNHDTALDYYQRALTIRSRFSSKSMEVADSLNNIGLIHAEKGAFDQARYYHDLALAMREDLAFGSLDVAASFYNLGLLAFERGDPAQAQEYHTRALAIQERLAPGSLDYADVLEGLGKVALQQGRLRDAETLLRQSTKVVEGLRAQIASPEARALLSEKHLRKYAALIQTSLALGDKASAFATLESARARALLELLADRSLDVTADAPPELIRRQQELEAQYAETNGELGSLSISAENAPQIETLHRALRDLERQQQELKAQMRADSPRYASLQYPQPLSLAEAQAALEPGTLLLSYLVEEKQTFLFAVTADSIETFALPLGHKELQKRTRDFRSAIDRRRIDHDPAQMHAQGRNLYDDLIRPAQAWISGVERLRIFGAERLLICPDGPLHTIPFGAFVTNPTGPPDYLGAQKPLHSILSVTVYAQLRKEIGVGGQVSGAGENGSSLSPGPRNLEPASLLALGDPLYAPNASNLSAAVVRSASFPEATGESARAAQILDWENSDSSSDDSELSQMQTRGLTLTPLPHTREEVLSLGRLFGASATVKVGADATKSAALQESGSADYLHFACHGWLDSKMPLHSALVLSQPEAQEGQSPPDDNGLLQAWEIFQKLHLKAELVTLSACKTGLGQEVRGEGMIGLTRAFQYAGAKSLVVSLWDIADANTPLFMQAFYAGIKEGMCRDDALRQGVLAMLANPETDHPFYWSAFVLIGTRN